MKTIKLLGLFILLFQLSACTDDFDDNLPEKPEPTLLGSWKLVNVSGGFANQNFDFEAGLITWTFNDNQTVTIVNNNTDDSKADYFDSGIYPYEYVLTNDSGQNINEVIIDGQRMGETVLLINQLTMDQSPFDGMKVRLVR